MPIDIRTLKSGMDFSIDIDLEVEVEESLLKKSNIINLKNVVVSGTIKNDYEGYFLDLIVKGVLVLPCSLTLRPVDYAIDIKIVGNNKELLGEMEEFNKNDENTLDIFPIIWENILMEIPIRVVSEGAEPLKEGDGWCVITDDEPRGSSPFDKLNELL